jgi:predicted O-methyltransferase YrrM
MDATLRAFLDELATTGTRHDQQELPHKQKMLNLEPDTAQLLSMLVRSGHRKHILEIGTSNGYSTIWLAWATQALGGHVTSIDYQPEKHALADANLRRAGLRDNVNLLQGDATEIVAQLSGPFDLIFFDADRYSAPQQLQLLLPKLLPDVLILADNVHSHPQEIAGYLTAIQAQQQFEHTIVPVGKGLSIAHRNSITKEIVSA